MKFNFKKTAITLLLFFVISSATHSSASELIFFDNFDNQAADEGSPDGFMSFGTSLSSVVVNTANPYSGNNSVIFSVDFTDGGWGAGMVAPEFEPTDFTGKILSAKFAASADLSAIPIISFRFEDEDGTIMRANLDTMFGPSTFYQNFSLAIASVNQIDARGADSVLNIQKIVSFGFCIYNNHDQDLNGVFHFYIDDIRIADQSEPDTMTHIKIENNSLYVQSLQDAPVPQQTSDLKENKADNKQTIMHLESTVMHEEKRLDTSLDDSQKKTSQANTAINVNAVSSNAKKTETAKPTEITSTRDILIYVTAGIFIGLLLCVVIWKIGNYSGLFTRNSDQNKV